MKISFDQTFAFAAVAAVIAFSSCNSSPFPGYSKTENGVYAKYYKHDGTSAKPKEGDVLKIRMLYKNSKDSVLFDSKKNPDGSNSMDLMVRKAAFKGCFEDALATLSIGDSASFKINADSLYMKTFNLKEVPKFIEKGSYVTFETTLLKVTPKDEMEKMQKQKMEEQKVMMEMRKTEEPKSIAKYLEDNKITVKPTASGIYLVEKTKGKGAKAVNGDSVYVAYTGRLLDGTVFDTSDEGVAKQNGMYDKSRPYSPYAFVLGSGGVIKGWEEALTMMNAGTKAQVLLPSAVAYGEQGGGPIPPYSPLVFDVELVKIIHKK